MQISHMQQYRRCVCRNVVNCNTTIESRAELDGATKKPKTASLFFFAATQPTFIHLSVASSPCKPLLPGKPNSNTVCLLCIVRILPCPMLRWGCNCMDERHSTKRKKLISPTTTRMSFFLSLLVIVR